MHSGLRRKCYLITANKILDGS